MANDLTVANETRPGTVQTLLNQPAVKARFESILGKRAPAFMSSIISAVSANPQLRECAPNSVVGAAAIAAAIDLPVTPGLGLAHIVPYKSRDGWTAQFQIGWKGFVQLAIRSGQYKTINLSPVLEGQIADHNPFTGDMTFSRHAESMKVVGYLLYFRLLNGYEKYFYMTREQCEAHGKKYSQTFKRGFGVWVDDFDAMALKTVAKLGLSKYGILSVEMQHAITGEDDDARPADHQDEAPAATGVAAINDKIRARKAAPKKDASPEPAPAPVTVIDAKAEQEPRDMQVVHEDHL